MANWPYNTAAWQRLRLAKLASDPLCQPCGMRGDLTIANTVDHVTAIASGGNAFPALNELMSMCERCHNEKTNARDHPNSKPFGRSIKGFDVDGNPIDPHDDWHAGGGTSNHENEPCWGPAGEVGVYLVLDQKEEGNTVPDRNGICENVQDEDNYFENVSNENIFREDG